MSLKVGNIVRFQAGKHEWMVKSIDDFGVMHLISSIGRRKFGVTEDQVELVHDSILGDMATKTVTAVARSAVFSDYETPEIECFIHSEEGDLLAKTKDGRTLLVEMKVFDVS